MNYSCKLCGHEYGTRPPSAPLIALHMTVSHKGETMKTAEFGYLHAWQGTANVILSDQRTGELSYFLDWDDLINHLYLTGNRDAARAINNQVKS